MPFVTKLRTRALNSYREGLREVQLSYPLVYVVPIAEQKTFHSERFRVPSGYISDYASIPKWARWLMSSWGRWAEPSVLHDYCYTHLHTEMSREDADKLFLVALKDVGVIFWRRQLMYYAVRVGGKGGWS